MNRKKIIVVFVVLIIMIIGVAAGVFLVGQQQELREKAAPATTLSMSPSVISPQVGDAFTVRVAIDTGENQVVGTELYIQFDPNVLEAQDVSVGSFFTNPEVIGPSINNTAGTASYTIFLPPGSEPQDGTGTVAIFSFMAVGQGQSTISFTDSTLAVAVGEQGQNVLTGATGTTINVGSQQVLPSPTPTQNLTPTPTEEVGTGGDDVLPTPTPTIEPTSTPTPTTASGGGGVGSTATPTPTLFNPAADQGDTELPDSGLGTPMIIGLGAAFLTIAGAFTLLLLP